MLNHTGGTCSHNGMMDDPRILISELSLKKFLDSMEFQSWKVNFKTEVCSKDSRSSSHNALDQRSYDRQINWRTYGIAIDYGANRSP